MNVVNEVNTVNAVGMVLDRSPFTVHRLLAS
jgi:hypothetical protein